MASVSGTDPTRVNRPGLARPAVFVDRDDTLNANAGLPDAAWNGGTPGDLANAHYMHLLPGALKACRAIKAAGFALVVFTNQGGVARGGVHLEDVAACNDRMRALLHPEGVPPPADDEPWMPGRPTLIDAIYYAPHHPKASGPFGHEHRWRKPNPGMIESAALELNLDLQRSWAVGDKARDIEAAEIAGVPSERCLLVGRDAPLADLTGAVELILHSSSEAGEILLPHATPHVAPHAEAKPRIVSASVVALRAADGALDAERVRQTVEATARAIAERTGVEILEIRTGPGGVRAVVATGRIAAMGFAAELRRLTNRWHADKLGGELWVTAPDRDERDA